MPNTTPIKQYVFSSLDSLEAGETSNVIGIVKFVNPVRCSKGSGYFQTIGLIDSTMVNHNDKVDCKKLICNIFSDARAKLTIKEGDAVILHRLKVNLFKEALQGQGIPSLGFSFGAYYTGDNDTIKSRPNSELRNVSPRDLEKVKELLSWRKSLDRNLFDSNVSVESIPANDMSDNYSHNFIQISEMAVSKYFDIRVQIVRIIRVKGWPSCLILRVWDGTKYSGHQPINRCLYSDEAQSYSPEEAPECERIHSVEMQAFDCAVDVFVYDEHCETVKQMRAGMFVDIINVHFMMKKQGSLDLTLHGGNRYGRSVKLFTASPTLLAKLKESGLLPVTEIFDPNLSNLPILSFSSLDCEDSLDDDAPSSSRLSPKFNRFDCILRGFYPDLTKPNLTINSLLNLLCPKCHANRRIDHESDLTLEDTDGWLVAHLAGTEMENLFGESLIRGWLNKIIENGQLKVSHFDNLIKNSIMLLLNSRLDLCVQNRGGVFYIVKTKIKN